MRQALGETRELNQGDTEAGGSVGGMVRDVSNQQQERKQPVSCALVICQRALQMLHRFRAYI